MKKFKWLFFIVGLMSMIESYAFEAEHVLWDKTPVPITLSLNKERLIHFPQAISVIENEAEEKIAILKVQGSLYLKPKESFHEQRLIVQLMPGGEVIILDLSVDEKRTSHPPIEILVSGNTQPTETKPKEPSNNFDLNAITMTRFAIQSLYAPQRLLVTPNGVSRIPMQTKREINLVYGASIEARPLISWHGGAFYITAIELKNLLNKETIVDPRHMLGHWQTATFYPTNILQARGKDDTTTVFLVSDRPFADSLLTSGGLVR